MSELEHRIELVMGDWSGDGHSRTASTHITCNRSRVDLMAAYSRGVKVTGVNLTGDVASNYEDNAFPRTFVQMLVTHGFKPLEFLEGNEEDGYMLWTDSFPLIWLFIAGVGDPELRYETVTDPRINIGGYGLFH